jgi:UDP-N-acetyl-D-glucosamine/UDP-N-acetyl-D-galactosamine dehydrogenase
MHSRSIAVVGMGYVGLPVAIAFGKSQSVVGFDIKKSRIEQLLAGFDATEEVSSEDLAISKVNYTSEAADLRSVDFFIVAVPTPVDAANKPDLSPLISASKSVGKVLKRGDIVVYESTVYPGATEEECIPVLERESGLKFMQDFAVGYSPERIVPGDKEHVFTNIRKIVAGSDAATLDIVAAVYESVVTAGVHRASSIKVAEAAKVIENTQRDINIALMNELAVVFKRMGIDTLEVLEAAGSKWNFLPFRPGLVGGHCIGVDPYYLTYQAEKLGYIPQVILAGRRINDNMARYVARETIKLMIQNGIDISKSHVGILGVTFKENCPDTRNSKVTDIVKELQDFGIKVTIVDPHADKADLHDEYGMQLGSIDATNPADALIVAVAHTEFRAMQPEQLKQLTRGKMPVIADVKSIYSKDKLSAAGFAVWRL